MRPVVLAALAALVAVAGCNRRQEAAAPAAPASPPAPVQPAGPLTYEKKTDFAEVSLKLPEAVGRIPALYARLFAENRNDLDSFAEGSTEDVQSLREASSMPDLKYEKEVAYEATAETPRLLSLTASTYENTGGAHPNGSMSAFLWDKATGKEVPQGGLFRANADMAQADKALCDALKAEKRERTGSDAFDTMFTGCPSLKKVQAVLRPSTTPGKAAGLTVLFSPYEVGPYVEGSYEIDVPLAAVQGVLAPEYAGEFGGTPAPEPKSDDSANKG